VKRPTLARGTSDPSRAVGSQRLPDDFDLATLDATLRAITQRSAVDHSREL
jgi:hypothetical protein